MPEFFNPSRFICPDFQSRGHQVPRVDIYALMREAVTLTHNANRLSRPFRYLEVGTFCGISALAVARAATSISRFTPEIHVVDPWELSPSETDPSQGRDAELARQAFDNNRRTYNDIVNFVIHQHRSDNWPSLESMPTGLDLVYIDGDHSYQSVLNDYRLYWACLGNDGVMMGHDFAVFPGVTQACEVFGIDGVIGTTWIKYKALHR